MNQIEVLCYERKPSLVLCAETRITEDICDSEYSVDGYNCIVCPAQTRFTGGVVMYVKKPIKFKVISNCNVEKLIWCLSIELFDCAIKGVYSVIYRSPAYNFFESAEFLDLFFDQTINLNKMNIVAGDFNIDINASNVNTRRISSLVNKYGLEIIVNFNTRTTNETQSLIDYVLTNYCDIVSCKPLPCDMISDHETIDIIISKQMPVLGAYKMVLSWSVYSKEQLIRNLRNCEWSCFSFMNIDNKLEILRSNLISSVIPLTKYVKINTDIKPKKWFDSELKAMKSTKIDKYNSWMRSKSVEAWNEYIAVRNEYVKFIKAKKKRKHTERNN